MEKNRKELTSFLKRGRIQLRTYSLQEIYASLFFTAAFYCYSTSFYLISNFQFSIFGSLLFISDQMVTAGLIHCLSSVGRS